jgi:hypothetical protein
MGEKKSWYSTGYEGVEKERDRLARLSGPNRFWMKPQTSREIVMIDDDPFCIYEHNPKANGTFQNWFTCLKDSNEDAPCCAKLGAKSRYYVGYYTIVDLTESKDAKGNSYQYELKFLPAKLGTLTMLRRKKQDRGSLIGAIFKVHRDKDDDPNCGSEFEWQREADLEKLYKVANYKGKKLPEHFAKLGDHPDNLRRMQEVFQLHMSEDGKEVLPRIPGFNYPSLLEPKSPRELKDILGSVTVDEKSGSEEPRDSNEVPF